MDDFGELNVCPGSEDTDAPRLYCIPAVTDDDDV